MPSHGAILSFIFQNKNGLISLKLVADGEPTVVGPPLTSQQLETELSDLNMTLGQFKQLIGGERKVTNWSNVNAAFQRLWRGGRSLASTLFGVDITKAQDLCQRKLDKRHKQVMKYLPRDPPESPPLIEVYSPFLECAVPIEFLPLWRLRVPDSITEANLMQECFAFFGFSSTVKRIISKTSIPADKSLYKEPKLLVKFFYNDGLPGARKEVGFFQREAASIDLEGPWPDKPFGMEEFKKTLANHMYYAAPRFNGDDENRIDQIHHFACHCDISGKSPKQNVLTFAHARSTWKVSLEDLRQEFIDCLNGEPRTENAAWPLLFFNACSSARTNLAWPLSFPKMAMANGNRGFVGTETVIPDKFAVEFSEQFYTELLRGRNLGEAIYSTKMMMLRKNNNPLGILYTMYADPDMRVEERAL